MSNIQQARKPANAKTEDDNAASTQPPRFSVKIVFCVFLFVFFMMLMFVQIVPGSYVSVLSVELLGWYVQFGATVTSIYWGMVSIGRLVAVPLAMILSQSLVLNGYFVMVIGGYILLFFVQQLGKPGLIAAELVIGFGVGPLYGGIIVWAAQHVAFTGFYSAVCNVGFSTGKFVMGLGLGNIFEHHDPVWILYIGLGCSILHFLWFIAMQVLAKRFMSWSVLEITQVSVNNNDDK